MNDHDGPRLADRHTAFMRLLPARAKVIRRRLDRFAQSGWDINGLARIHADAGRLGDASQEHGLEQIAGHLRELAEQLATPLNEQELPDRDLGERLCALAQSLDELVPPAPEPELPEPVEAYEAIDDSQATAAAGAVEASDASPEDDVDIWGDGVALFGPGKPKAETVAPQRRS